MEEEEDHFTQTQLSLLSYTTAYGSRDAALGSPSFSLVLYWFSLTLCSVCSAQFALLSCCLFIGKNGATSSSSSSTMVAPNL